MGAAASRRRALRSEAMSSVAAKVRAARAFGEYLSQNHPENRNGADDTPIRTWFPKENLFSFQAATTTMQAVFRGYAERKRRKRENDSASVIQRNFRKHLRMVGSRRVKAQTFAERRERSFSRSWSDPTPMKADTSHDSRDSSDLQSSHCTLGEAFEDLDWETEKGLEAVACDTEGFVPPKVMLISSKVPKAEYIPTIIRRDDPSIIPILYDHEHATFEDILEEIEKKLNIYHKGAKIWKMLIFCQGGPGHLYLLKNKVATFAKVEKEEDMIHFWKRLSRLMSKMNPEPNVIHIMGCYILGNPNGEKLFQNLRTLMTPYRVTFESPLELSAQDDRDLLRLPPVPPVEEPPALEAAGLRGRSVRAGPPPGHVLRRQGLGRGVPDRVSPGRHGHFREASPAQVRAGSGPQPGQGSAALGPTPARAPAARLPRRSQT
ncbi:NMDA receptor synaptonuclear signaling and neuronal migration factor isoform X9 [Rhinolophus sinicus]|uniref:NMDA receptor synaptonuclear signaling and neuronal migration factor isoform X9 n=1 Tax=Rhinolophus sinicus TaxID=89399 RepID=UPI003D7BE15B